MIIRCFKECLYYFLCLIKWWLNVWKVFEFFFDNVWIYNLFCYKEEGKIWLIGNEILEKCSINILIKELDKYIEVILI